VDVDCGVPRLRHGSGSSCSRRSFARSRESINILVEGIVDTCICGVTFWAWGFVMFMDGTPFIGTHGFFLKGIPDTLYLTTGVPLLAYWVFQFAFADTCSTITSGAMVGRCVVHRRHPLLDRRHRVHLSDRRPLVLGSGRIPRHDGDAVPRLRGLDRRPHDRRRDFARGAVALGPRLDACSHATAAVRCCRTTSSSARSAA
jgi:hypothetical protein